MLPGCVTLNSPGYIVPGTTNWPPNIAREQVGVATVVTVVVTMETEVTVLAEGHVEGAAVQEALEVIVTVDGAVQLGAMVGELVDEVTELDIVAANMQEQPLLNFEGTALHGDRKVGNPVVAV